MHPRLTRPFAGIGLAVAILLAAIPAASAAGFPDRVDLPNGFRPEGISSGPGSTFYVGSLADGAIYRGDLRTGTGSIIAAGQSGWLSVGTEYEAGAGRLWVAGGTGGDVRVYDAATGDVLAVYPLAGGFLNDVAVTRDAAYVTDSFAAQLDVVPIGAGGSLADPGDAYALPLTGDFVLEAGFNLNGIVAVRGQLVAVQSGTGLLFAIDPATGVTSEIDTGGVSVTAGDGLFVQGTTLYVVRNQFNLVAVFRLSADLSSATLLGDLTSAGLDVPTTVTVSNGRLWAVNARFATPPMADTEYWVTRLPILP